MEATSCKAGGTGGRSPVGRRGDCKILLSEACPLPGLRRQQTRGIGAAGGGHFWEADVRCEYCYRRITGERCSCDGVANPTPDEIREACEQIQAGWDEGERERRRTRFAGGGLWATMDELSRQPGPIRSYAANGNGEFSPLAAGYPAFDD